MCEGGIVDDRPRVAGEGDVGDAFEYCGDGMGMKWRSDGVQSI